MDSTILATENQLSYALYYLKMGFSIIPVPWGKKEPIIKWKIYQKERASEKQIRQWFGNSYPLNIAIITGSISGVMAVDSDSEQANVWVGANLPTTPMITRTPNEGRHNFYRYPGVSVRNKARIETGVGKLALDIRGDGGYVIAPGSKHPNGGFYEREGSWDLNTVPIFDPAWIAAEKQHIETPTTCDKIDVLRRARLYLGKVPGAVEGNGGDNHTFVTACRAIRGFGLTEDDAFTLLWEWNCKKCVPPWSEEEIREKIRNAEKYGSGPKRDMNETKPRKNLQHGRKENSVEKPIETASVPNLVDVCADESGKPVFLLRDGTTLNVCRSVEIGGVVYIPPRRDSMPWLLPRAGKIIRYFNTDRDDSLFSDIIQAIRGNSDLPDERLYPLLASWVLHTHLIDKFHHSPIIIFYAVAARGKTRTCRILLWMSRRGIHVENLREPDIIRKSQRFRCAFLFDIMDVWKKAERMGAEDILLGRFDDGVIVPRVTKPEINGFGDTQHFSCFGPTLIASNEPAHRILDTRGILVTMRQAIRRFDNDPREPDFLVLRERATAFRARWMANDIPAVEKPARDRLGDIIRPLVQVCYMTAPKYLPDLKTYIKTIQEEKAEALADTPEGVLVEALIGLDDDVFGGMIETKMIAEQLNKGKPERYHITPFTVGKRMAALGFQATRISGKKRGFTYDKKVIGHLAEQYGYADVESGVSDVSDAQSINAASAVDRSSGSFVRSGTTLSPDTIPNLELPDICQPANVSQNCIRADMTDTPDNSGTEKPTVWDGETCEQFADIFSQKSLASPENTEDCVPDPDLPEDY